MSKFKFKLEPVKKAKENLESKVKREIAQLNSKINDKKSERDKLIQEVDSIRNYNLQRVRSYEMQFIQNYKIVLNSKIKDIEKEMIELEAQKEIKIKQLQIYAKEKKIIEQYEEIKKAEYDKEQNKIEMKLFDELAIQNFLRERI
jgi:flagellar export protein FliJ